MGAQLLGFQLHIISLPRSSYLCCSVLLLSSPATMSNSEKKVFVTGASGFICTHIVKLLIEVSFVNSILLPNGITEFWDS
jgi:hypothetical protein